MRTIWKRAPLLRLVMPWMVGLFLADAWPYGQIPIALLMCCLTVVAMGYWAYQHWFMQRHWLGLGIMGCFLACGWLYGYYRYSSLLPVVPNRTEKGIWLVRLTEQPVERAKSYRCAAELIGGCNDSVSYAATGKILVYLQKCQAIDTLRTDDVLWLCGGMQAIPKPRAPGEFDLQRHGRRKGVHLQLYADSTHWQWVCRPNNHSVQYYMEEWRSRALACLRELNDDPKTYGVLAALILGDTSDMDPELMTSYAAAGVVHVLAVSGLHVGLVYMLLTPIFLRVFGRARARWWRTLLPIALLWLYSGLSGGSPSVLRAAVMFSGFIVADNFGKHNNIYNTLASSAFVLLVVKPAMLFDLGFQLSYLAVAGIVILQKPLSQVIHVPNKWLDKVWTMSAVSVAAQISTLPLTLYYFHQFPNYFLASNLFVIPWSTLIIYLSIVFYVVLPWPWLAQHIAELLVWMTRLMNKVIIWFEHLPCSVTTQIGCDIWQFWSLSLALFFGLRWLFWKNKPAFLALLSVCLFHLGYGWYREAHIASSEELLVYANGHSIGAAHRKGQHLRWYSFDKTAIDPGYGWLNYVRENDVKRIDTCSAHSALNCPLFAWKESVIYVADSAALARFGWVKCDIVILHHLGRFRFDAKKMDIVENTQIVFGPGISRKKRRWLRSQWKDRLDCVDLSKGAWVIDNRRLMPYVSE